MSTDEHTHVDVPSASISSATVVDRASPGESACSVCGQPVPPVPLQGERAAALRAHCRRILGEEHGDRVAYQHARAAIAIGSDAAVCTCKTRSWFEAGDEYVLAGGEACWRGLGVTRLTMQRMEARRLGQVSMERKLTAAEAAELAELEAILALN